jgi:hypothetical protein
MMSGPHDPHDLRDIKIRLAAALGRSKFRASPLDRTPRSLIGGDAEPIEVALELRARLLEEIGESPLALALPKRSWRSG